MMTTTNGAILGRPRRLIAILLLVAFAATAAWSQPGGSAGGFTFFAIGDAGHPGPILQSTALAMRNEATRLSGGGDALEAVIFLGDNFYITGLNHEAEERGSLINDVIGPHRSLLGQLGRENVHTVAGNHDYYCETLGPAPYGTCYSGNRYESVIPEWTYYSGFPSSVRYPTGAGEPDSIELFFFDSAILLAGDRSKWRAYLDSLAALFTASTQNRSVRWRLLFAHHSPYSVGAHGGYRGWDPKRNEVLYVGNCIDEGDDPFKYLERLAGYHEDVCDPTYQAYKDSLFAVIDRTGITIQAMFAGHDHSLQLLNHSSRTGSPKIFIVSGAGSKQDYVRSPLPPFIYSHPYNDSHRQGESAVGFIAGSIERERLHLRFIDGENGERLDMGGASDFYIDRNGSLVEAR